LKPILGEDQVGEIERQVEAGKLSLADLNSLAEQGIEGSESRYSKRPNFFRLLRLDALLGGGTGDTIQKRRKS